MSRRKPDWAAAEAQRRRIAEEADRLCIPAFLTPTWQAIYGRK